MDKFPIGLLGLTAPSEIVDVNLDPNKTSFMIQKQNRVLEFLEVELKKIYVITGNFFHERKKSWLP